MNSTVSRRRTSLSSDANVVHSKLSRTRKDVGDREGTTRDREDLIHKLQLEVQQLTTQLNTQLKLVSVSQRSLIARRTVSRLLRRSCLGI
jgi:hypothetical protein